MRKPLSLALVLMLGAGLAQAASLTITDGPATFTLNYDDPGARLNDIPDAAPNTPPVTPSSPVQLIQTIEWIVEGRRILVFPSAPSNLIDLGHIHPGAHVGDNQMHVQGPLLGYANDVNDPQRGTLEGSVIHSVQGGPSGSGRSTITEKVDIINKTGSAVNVSLAGLGWDPARAASRPEGIELPDWTGLNITGRTVVFLQGSPENGFSVFKFPYPPVRVLPGASFSGFNPYSHTLGIPADETLTMITELTVMP